MNTAFVCLPIHVCSCWVKGQGSEVRDTTGAGYSGAVRTYVHVHSQRARGQGSIPSRVINMTLRGVEWGKRELLGLAVCRIFFSIAHSFQRL